MTLALPRRHIARELRRAYRLHRDGQLGEAMQLYASVLTHEPTNAMALHYAALIGRHLNDHAKQRGLPTNDEAVMRLMALSVAYAPDNPAAIHNFAKFKHDRGELDDAKQLYETAVALDPTQGESWTNLGNVWGELGNRLRAEACWLRALECPSSLADARFNLSFLRLMKGDFARGWAEYECRWDSPTFRHGYGRPELTAPKWDGAPITGTLLLHQEQGAGDAIWMWRYVPLIRARVGRLVIEVIPGLASLFRAFFPDVEVIARGDARQPIPPHDAQLAMLSLPSVFGTTLETIPECVPVPAELASIRPESGRIGLCWRGSTTHTNDRIRSIPFEATWPLLDEPGLTWQSLQFGWDTSPPLDQCPPGDFLETACAIARCSLVISCDTSTAHLAASMGVSTWILLPFSAEWRWLEDRIDSPWYPSAVLHRQAIAGDWLELTRRLAPMLAAAARRGDA